MKQLTPFPPLACLAPFPKIIRASSSEVRAAFALWLGVEFRAGIKLVILEGMTSSGKTRLTNQPFILDGGPSTNIEMDDFLPPILLDDATPYLAAIDQAAMLEEVAKALREPSMVILQGAVVWPAVEAITARLGVNGVRRVYLKKMAHLMPDFWEDEDCIFDPEFDELLTGYRRSIHSYHAEQRPWLKCDLVIERIAEKKMAL
jgi:hypothetical protein